MKFEKSDIITCESYKGLCDYIYSPDKDPVSGLVHVNMEEIPTFLTAIKNYPERKYVVVSSCSDFGLCYQQYNPVWIDTAKWVRMMARPEMNYKPIGVQPRCNLDKCNPDDKFSVKCYSFTAFTFAAIPDNIVHWFVTNSRVTVNEEPKLTIIPFGVAPGAADDIIAVAKETEGYEKEPKVYINWVCYTSERYDVKEYYRLLSEYIENITIVDEPKPYKSYLRDLARHSVVLSPEGNGVDCYRTLESMYMGSMPVVELSATTAEFGDLPLAIAKTMYGMRPNELHDAYLKVKDRPIDKIKLSYWKGKFEQERLKAGV